MKVKALIWQEDGGWCGSVPALPGCHTWGETYEQLLSTSAKLFIHSDPCIARLLGLSSR
ncbi:MAG: type II toxin-antitoxin system HicB family antitoxin [Snowella sp.]|nr:type II toxin-antitoxin system HicB family antitoxin [Snowella sp.]